MTTIVYRDGILAADTRATHSGSILPERNKKVHRLRDGRLFAWCGDAGLGQRVLDHFNDPSKAAPEISDKGGALVIGLDGSIWTYEYNAMLLARGAPYRAMGSGRCEAYGALAMGASARRAVSVAAMFDTGTGGGVMWLRL